eukprot:CAMPEP_0185850358 /NCGR_PEP_ID=MMETSP1354-20130828/4521_1 /TAXON_ID=708628 /ORGANISM="Erythrolobus madagascarensis, Strain CCMP3276" /LENGTH=126 /DNA_ID=CAMNT_0028551025 /DNA_START=433 /DNA_END=810 /DNA_ORIENTATION=+
MARVGWRGVTCVVGMIVLVAVVIGTLVLAVPRRSAGGRENVNGLEDKGDNGVVVDQVKSEMNAFVRQGDPEPSEEDLIITSGTDIDMLEEELGIGKNATEGVEQGPDGEDEDEGMEDDGNGDMEDD